MSELVKRDFPYEPAATQKKEVDVPVVTMARFTVTESRRSRQLEEEIKSENEKMKAEQFTITKGGTIWKKGQVELGVWYTPSGIKFLKYSW